MKERELYTTASLELHLFFLRIMKEHAIFLIAGILPANTAFSKEARQFQTLLENLLLQAAQLGDGIIRSGILDSREIVTPDTLTAEQDTQLQTNLPIRCPITEFELELITSAPASISLEQSQQVKYMNQQVLLLLHKYIRFHEKLLEHRHLPDTSSATVSVLIRHMLNETVCYQTMLTKFENESAHAIDSSKPDHLFWKQILTEHNDYIAPHLATLEIPSGIRFLLSDHILRETNHYVRIS